MTNDPQGPWRPILQGPGAEQAFAAAEEIAGALLGLRAAGPRHCGLSELAGWSLFFAYLDRARPGRGYLDQAAGLLEAAVAGLGRSHSPPSLYAGFPGVAWVVEHLKGWVLADDEEDDPGEEIAAAVCRLLERSPWRGDHDLLSGLAGLGVYALERAPRRWGRESLEAAVARLAETAERRPEGVAWRSSPEVMGPKVAQQYPRGNFDLGVAYGAPGIAALLALASAAGVAARPLLDESVAWLLAQRLPAGERSVFPHVVAPEQPPQPARLAWCHGDLGVAAALLLAARCTGEPDWEREALETARTAAGRSPEISGVVDAPLCHGAAGNAHLFNRIYQATGDPACAAAARFWLERTLALRRPGEGIGGYLSWDTGDMGNRVGWREDPSFLWGATGIGLALLAAASSVEPAWDRLLLASIPPRPEFC
ncbi:MAG TPA: lanthionine synthetase C family protein [Thermoanaerobaculia bacterium]|jgi:lantibiotic modifying enzyme|nr:lanthionine synthetase C family protein [Thermoanaerobaculia bacterium]